MNAHSLLSIVILSALASAADTGRGATAPVRPARIVQRYDSQWVRKANEVLSPANLRGRVLEEVAAELATAGPNAIQSYFAILAGTVDGPLTQGAHRPAADALDPDAILLSALARMNPSQVAQHVAVAASGDASLDVKVIAMRVLSGAAAPEALDAWLEVATGIGALHMSPPYVRAPCEEALASILSQDARLFARLARRSKSIDPQLLPVIANGVAGSRRKQGLPFLFEGLGHDHELDIVLLPCIATLAETTSGDLTEDELTWLRPFASDLDWRVRREALLALGRVQDWRSHVEFEAALGDDQRPVQQAAQWALAHMSKADLGFDKRAWHAWFDTEIMWYEMHGARWNQAVQTAKPGPALEAVRELVGHTLFRHDVARTVSSLCASENADLVAQACLVLRDLDSPAACPALVEALGSDDAAIREAARAALSAITHLQIAPEPRAWRRALVGA